MVAEVRRAMGITARLNRLAYDDAAQIRALFGELIGQGLDDGFCLIPPFCCTGGRDTRVGRKVFINHNCNPLSDCGCAHSLSGRSFWTPPDA